MIKYLCLIYLNENKDKFERHTDLWIDGSRILKIKDGTIQCNIPFHRVSGILVNIVSKGSHINCVRGKE